MAFIRYPFELEEKKNFEMNLLYVTYSKFENDWQSIPHTHPFTELCYIKKGRGTYLIEDKEYHVKESDFIIINMNVSHTEKSTGNIPLEYIILGVEGLNFSKKEIEDSIIINCNHEHEEYLFYLESLLSEMEQQQPNYKLVCRNYLEILVVKLIRRSITTRKAPPTVNASKECLKLKYYIETNYPLDITLDTLATLSHLNKYYLVHAFTKMFGCSPISYLSQVRIKSSMELLKSTNYSITEISQTLGFSSPSYFAQCFQKQCNMTAREYRKSCLRKK